MFVVYLTTRRVRVLDSWALTFLFRRLLLFLPVPPFFCEIGFVSNFILFLTTCESTLSSPPETPVSLYDDSPSIRTQTF